MQKPTKQRKEVYIFRNETMDMNFLHKFHALLEYLLYFFNFFLLFDNLRNNSVFSILFSAL